jgi:hypothetical protein
MKALLSLTFLTISLLVEGCVVGPVVRYRVREVHPAGLTSEEILKMSKSGVSDNTIVEKIKEVGVATRPSADQVHSLKKEGLSDSILKAMIEAPVTGPEQKVVEYVYYPHSSYYPYYYPYSYPYYPYYWGGPYGYWPYWGWHYGYRWH